MYISVIFTMMHKFISVSYIGYGAFLYAGCDKKKDKKRKEKKADRHTVESDGDSFFMWNSAAVREKWNLYLPSQLSDVLSDAQADCAESDSEQCSDNL